MSKVRETFIGFVAAETDRALLFQDHFWHAPDWLPKSQADIFREEDTHEIKVTLSPWIVGQKQIEEFVERLPPEDKE